MSSGQNTSQTIKMEASSNDIENELIKLTTNSNASKPAGTENSSIHSSMMSRAGGAPAYQGSIKSEAGAA